MKIRVEFNDTPYPAYNPNDKDYSKKQEIAGAGVNSPLWEKAQKGYGFMIAITNGTATIVRGNGELIAITILKVRVIDEEYIDTNPTK